MRVAVMGASGTIGRPLVEALSQTHEVVGVARRPPRDNHVNWVAADATDAVAISSALEGIDVVYHLVHSLGSADFEERDRAAATVVAEGAAKVDATQIVYLGGLGDDASELSSHLRSRAETAEILAGGTVPVTMLRAAMIVGPGSVAFETILALVERLPVMAEHDTTVALYGQAPSEVTSLRLTYADETTARLPLTKGSSSSRSQQVTSRSAVAIAPHRRKREWPGSRPCFPRPGFLVLRHVSRRPSSPARKLIW